MGPFSVSLRSSLIATAILGGPASASSDVVVLTPRWEYVADTVMGGISTGSIALDTKGDSTVARLIGRVSLENNGGFVQMAFDLQPGGETVDASGWSGIEIDVQGNGEVYDLRLRTDQLNRPWQSFRASFEAPQDWTTIRFPFDTFQPHRIEAQFDPARLRRIGVLAIGREFDANVAVSAVRFYR